MIAVVVLAAGLIGFGVVTWLAYALSDPEFEEHRERGE